VGLTSVDYKASPIPLLHAKLLPAIAPLGDTHLQFPQTQEQQLDNHDLATHALYQVTMPATLLTGANSFVGAHVINSLIAAGHTVVGTVRRENLISQIYALHPEWKEKLELIVVKDYAEESSWDEVFDKYSLDHVRPRPFLSLYCR
jgi:hypothetical protein